MHSFASIRSICSRVILHRLPDFCCLCWFLLWSSDLSRFVFCLCFAAFVLLWFRNVFVFSYAQFRVDRVNLFSRDFASIVRCLLFCWFLFRYSDLFRFMFCLCFALVLKRFFSDAQFRVDPVNLFSCYVASIAGFLQICVGLTSMRRVIFINVLHWICFDVALVVNVFSQIHRFAGIQPKLFPREFASIAWFVSDLCRFDVHAQIYFNFCVALSLLWCCFDCEHMFSDSQFCENPATIGFTWINHRKVLKNVEIRDKIENQRDKWKYMKSVKISNKHKITTIKKNKTKLN